MMTDSITCPRCGAKSYHPEDIRQGYCGRCHWWTSDPQLGQIEPPSEYEPVDEHYRPEMVFAVIMVMFALYGVGLLIAWLVGAL